MPKKGSIEKTKEQKIRFEISQITKIFKNIDGDKTTLAKRLIDRAGFMKVSLQEMEETINQKGYVVEYQNGENQWGTKKSPEVEIYNTLIKNYQSIIDSLCRMLPEAIPKDDKKEIYDFIKGDKGRDP